MFVGDSFFYSSLEMNGLGACCFTFFILHGIA